MTAKRGNRKIKNGIVVSCKRDKTITVRIERVIQHPRYSKMIKQATKVHAHNENHELKEGDKVSIVETRPLSKQKRWRVVAVL